MKLFLQKNTKFSSAGGSAPRPPCLRQLGASLPDPHWPTAAGGSAPDSQNSPPRAKSWLRAWTFSRTPHLLQTGFHANKNLFYVCYEEIFLKEKKFVADLEDLLGKLQ